MGNFSIDSFELLANENTFFGFSKSRNHLFVKQIDFT
jgi:hypothetical protein